MRVRFPFLRRRSYRNGNQSCDLRKWLGNANKVGGLTGRLSNHTLAAAMRALHERSSTTLQVAMPQSEGFSDDRLRAPCLPLSLLIHPWGQLDGVVRLPAVGPGHVPVAADLLGPVPQVTVLTDRR